MEPVDDESIDARDPLWRRIHPSQVVPDSNRGGYRPSSASFADHPNGTPMSVILGKDVVAAGRTADNVLASHAGFSLAAITAGDARDLEQIVYRKPELHEPAHAEVKGPKPKRVQRSLAQRATWVLLRPPA